MATFSGKNGAISSGGTAVSTVNRFGIKYKGNNSKVIASNTGGGQIATQGINEWEGTFEANGRELPLVPAGASAFIGDNGTTKASGNIVVSSMDCDIDYETLKAITMKGAFIGNGALTFTAGTSVVDSSAPAVFVPAGAKVTWQPIVSGTLGTAANLPNPKSAKFSMKCDVKKYTATGAAVRSSLAGLTTFDGISVTLADGSLEAISTAGTQYSPGTQGILKFYVTSTLFFGFTYVTVADIDNACDMETGDIVGHTINFDWSAFATISGTQTRGSVVTPGSTSLWS